jgi:hypothetical protein
MTGITMKGTAPPQPVCDAGNRSDAARSPASGGLDVDLGRLTAYNLPMATRERTVRLPHASYDLLLQEANRRGVEPDARADELVRADLTASTGDLESALAGLSELRRRLPDIDGVVLAREARTELVRRGT